eukprot:g31727.t1
MNKIMRGVDRVDTKKLFPLMEGPVTRRHRFKVRDRRDFDQLNEKDVESNNQMAFDIAEREFGISPVMTGKEMAAVGEPDKLSMVMYLSQFYEMLKDTAPE